MQLCNSGQALMPNDISNHQNLSIQNKLDTENCNNNQSTQPCFNCARDNNNSQFPYPETLSYIDNNFVRATTSNSRRGDGFFIEDRSWKESLEKFDVEDVPDDNGNNHDCRDDPHCDIHYHKRFYDKPKFPEIADGAAAATDQPASFIVQTQIFPVCGVFETTVLPEDSSPDEPLSPVDSMADIDAGISKFAKDTANERRVAEGEAMKRATDLAADSWLAPSMSPRRKKTTDNAEFDVYNIETALPHIDLEAIESHLKQSKRSEAEETGTVNGRKWPVQDREHILQRFNNIARNSGRDRRRNDREEIRRRLAMGGDTDDSLGARKPSLQSRLQGGMNLQICFMNDIGNESDTESGSPPSPPSVLHAHTRPTSLPIKNSHVEAPTLGPPGCLGSDTSLAACQARLQAEARHALMQAHEMARMQMQIDRQRLPVSPITQMIRHSLVKVGVPVSDDRRRLSRQLLTEMNVAQLQIIINDLHTQIELLNEELVQLLVSRDDLHMEQDSMLVDIEDLTRFINAKCAQEGAVSA